MLAKTAQEKEAVAECEKDPKSTGSSRASLSSSSGAGFMASLFATPLEKLRERRVIAVKEVNERKQERQVGNSVLRGTCLIRMSWVFVKRIGVLLCVQLCDAVQRRDEVTQQYVRQELLVLFQQMETSRFVAVKRVFGTIVNSQLYGAANLVY